jgi:hypothetical protein
MRKLLTIFLTTISLTLMAQVPQGVGYQGVATDANGIELDSPRLEALVPLESMI